MSSGNGDPHLDGGWCQQIIHENISSGLLASERITRTQYDIEAFPYIMLSPTLEDSVFILLKG